MIAEGIAVQLVLPRKRGVREVSLDLAERALESGLPLASPAGASFALDRAFSCDPVAIAGDARFAKILISGLEKRLDDANFAARIAGKKGFVQARRDWLTGVVTRAKEATIAGLDDALRILGRTSAELFDEFPEARTTLQEIDAVTALARSLRGGVFAELTWPAFESASAELGTGRATSLFGCFPHAILSDGKRVIVVDHDRRILEHELRLPTGMSQMLLFFVPDDAGGGQLFVGYPGSYNSYGGNAYWSGNPDEVFPFTHPRHMAYIPTPGGGLSFGGRAFRIGDTQLETREVVLSDGRSFFAGAPEKGQLKLHELDPRDGRLLGAALPSPIAASITEGWELVEAKVRPAAGIQSSPLGIEDGVLGSWVLAEPKTGAMMLHCIDGATRATTISSMKTKLLVTFPHASSPQPVRDEPRRHVITLYDTEGHLLGPIAAWNRGGWDCIPPLAFWHHLRARDERGSEALRALTTETARGLLDAALAEPTSTRDAIERLLPAVTSPQVRDGIFGVVEHAAGVAQKLAVTVEQRMKPALTEARLPPQLALPGDKALRDALRNLLEFEHQNGEVLRQLAEVAHALEHGGTFTAQSTLRWELLVGHIRGVALLAVAPGTSEDERRTIRTLLDIWKDSILARAPGRIRFVGGLLDRGSSFLGVAMRPTWMAEQGGSRYFVRAAGGYVSFIEHATDGVFRLPDGFTPYEELHPLADDARWLESFVTLLDERGTPSWNPAAPADLARRTGLSRAEAILLWACLPGEMLHGGNFLDRSVRDAIGLSMSDASLARETLLALDRPKRRALFAAAAPTEPGALWDPLGEDGPVARLAAAWIARFGARTALREDVVALVDKELASPIGAAALLGALVAPATAPMLALPTVPDQFEDVHYAMYRTVVDRFSAKVVTATAMLLPFLFAELPVGDAYRDLLSAFVAAVHARTTAPGTLLPMLNVHDEAATNNALVANLVGTPIKVTPQLDGLDTGTMVIAMERAGTYMRVALRADRVPRLAEAGDVWRLHRSVKDGHQPPVIAAAFLEEQGPAFLDRIAQTPVPRGAYEANPLLSAPEVVAAIRERHTLSAEAAMLYAQLLALGEPTAKRVQTFNAWKRATYERAATELVTAKLVVPGKRERAGREIFLPGGWSKGTKDDLPQETWKAPLFVYPRGALPQRLPPLPLHAMFQAAWARVEAGDPPKLDEV